MTKKLLNSDTIAVARTMIFVVLAFLFFVTGIYFIAGDQFRFRDSRANITMGAHDGSCPELVEGLVIEETFYAPIHRYDTVSVAFGTFYNRPNSGMVTMELLVQDSDLVVLKKSFDVSEIKDGDVVSMSFDPSDPIREQIVNSTMVLRLTSNSVTGKAITPLTTSQNLSGGSLSIDGEAVDGSICFSVTGTDYIWLGTNYWYFVAGATVGLILICLFIWLRYANGKKSYVVTASKSFMGYGFLIKQLVSRDFKRKYKRSVLGVLWSFINPLLTMLVQFFVFSNLFRFDQEFYPAYLLIGVISFTFFSESCSMALNSITGNTALIKKVYVPKYIYPLTTIMSSMINFAISLIPLLLVCLISGVPIRISWVLAIYFFLCLAVFCLGLGLLLSSAMVFFRDTQFIWNVLSLMWMYATPIFWTENILAPEFSFIFTINPLYHFLKNARICILNGVSPEPSAFVVSALIAFGMLIVGSAVFKKTQDKFIMYV